MFVFNANIGYDSLLLALSPLENESFYCADDHLQLIDCVLAFHSKNRSNLFSSIADLCPTNKVISTIISNRCFWCAIHFFSLAVEGVVSTHRNIVDMVNFIMIKLCGAVEQAQV